jgi:hypothetical protein
MKLKMNNAKIILATFYDWAAALLLTRFLSFSSRMVLRMRIDFGVSSTDSSS